MVRVQTRRRYAIVVHEASLWTNGCIQNGFFLKVALEAAGYRADLVAFGDPSKGPQAFGTIGEIRVLGGEFAAHDYHTMVYMTRMPGAATVKVLRAQGLQLVGYNCGNVLMFDLEEWLGFRKPRADDPLHTAHSRICSDESWTIPFLAPLAGYIDTVGRQPGHIVPHLWGPDILASSLKGAALPRYAPLGRKALETEGMDVVILEPNISLVKTSWIPLVIAENIFLREPRAINTVHILCAPTNDTAKGMLGKLAISAAGKIQTYERMAMIDILKFFARGTRPVVFLCHQLMNGQNYTYYEILSLGWPLVHNSDIIAPAGYHYPGEDVVRGADAVLAAARTHHYRGADYAAQAAPVLASVNPRHPPTVAAQKQVADGSFVRHAAKRAAEVFEE